LRSLSYLSFWKAFRNSGKVLFKRDCQKITHPKSAIDFVLSCLPTGRAVNVYKNAMQYKENYLQILMVMVIV